jgi:hypothetical protein
MKISSSIILFLCVNAFCFGQKREEFVPNYEESKVPDFQITNPLKSFSRLEINSIYLWETIRRPELLDFFSCNVYGKVPGPPDIVRWQVVEEGNYALNGKARRRQVDIIIDHNGKTLIFNLLLYLPKNIVKAPVFLGYNFNGNHTVCNDTNILISHVIKIDSDSFGKVRKPARGAGLNSWQVEKLIDSGYGLATIYYEEVDPDKNDFSDGIHSLFYIQNQQKPAVGEWGSIAAWAWGLSRAMDYIEQDDEVDETKVILFGHSRLGKTALWAGATDNRFAAVISNNSGCGGAALSKRQFGETVARINSSFPHWFTLNFSKYNLNEKALPVDQHELLALIAPRPVYVASAEDDKWADPRGEFLSAFYATPVYELYGKAGIPSSEMPSPNMPVHNTVAYHIRTGKHAVTLYDWEQYIKWADEQLFEAEYEPKTEVSIRNEKFYINGKPTFEGRIWQGYSVEGLLPNSRMVNGTFDDLNPETVIKWKYPDTGIWDPERNSREFIDAMPNWKNKGLLAFTINFQGGSPEGYSATQPWDNNAFEPDGTIRASFFSRMEKIIKKADDLGMIVILGIFYFGQDERLEDENAVINALDNVLEWIHIKKFTNVIIEVANESNHKAYDHDIIKNRVCELILRVKENAPQLLVSTSFGGGFIPPEKVVEVSDFVLIHGNGVHEPEGITKMVETVRTLSSYRPMPIIFNEDDHYNFNRPVNHFVNATKVYASWGFFDYRRKNEGFEEGYQSVPVSWCINSDRKRNFFNKVKEIFLD